MLTTKMTLLLTSAEQIRERIKQLLSQTMEPKIAVAFWGLARDITPQNHIGLTEKHFAKAKIICNLGMGGTNPEAIKTLRKFLSPECIRHSQRLHAKVFIGDRGVIVGSANASANGLGLEERDFQGWDEAVTYTEEPHVVAEAKRWFDAQWNASIHITDADLRDAEKAFLRNRATKATPLSNSASNLSTLLANDPTALDRTNLRVIVYMASKKSAIALEHDKMRGTPTGGSAEEEEAFPTLEKWYVPRAYYIDCRWPGRQPRPEVLDRLWYIHDDLEHERLGPDHYLIFFRPETRVSIGATQIAIDQTFREVLAETVYKAGQKNGVLKAHSNTPRLATG